MYVAVKGGEQAIDKAHTLLANRRRGDRSVPALTLDQITEQLSIAVDRVMGEGSLYDPELSALAVKQARGDMIEAIFLLRAYRTTLPRFGTSEPLDTGAMCIERRVSATFKDLPGGQVLGPTFDYTHRLLDGALAAKTFHLICGRAKCWPWSVSPAPVKPLCSRRLPCDWPQPLAAPSTEPVMKAGATSQPYPIQSSAI